MEKIIVTVDEDLIDLVPGYLQNRRNDFATMQSALASEEYDVIRVIGHAMKGSGGGYGFAEITAIGGGLEAAAKSHAGRAIGELLDRLEEYLGLVEVMPVANE